MSPYLKEALTIAQGLAHDAVPTSSGATWQGDDLIGGSLENCSIVRGPVGSDFYSGAAGIGWFLGHVAHLDTTGICAATAEASMRFALSEATKKLKTLDLSLYSGATGIALAAMKVGERLGSMTLRRAGLKLARQIARIVRIKSASFQTDLISGLAGIVIGLLAIYRKSNDTALRDACRVGCSELVRRAKREWWGWSWPEDNTQNRIPALCGLAHGASGIGWALSEMGWVTGDHGFLSAADEAFRYERSWFSVQRCAWPDLRELDENTAREGTWPGWIAAWCHGALGIGAVRLRVYEATNDLTPLAEASAAIQAARTRVMQSGSALRRGEVSDVTLCHGLSGAAELFLLAYEILKQEDHLRAARRVGDLCLDILRQNNDRWTYGLQGARYVPGLFLGLAGIGLTMVRLHDPHVSQSAALLRY